MSIAKIMTKDLIHVERDATVEKMHDILQAHSIQHILVMDADKLVGVVTDRDIYRITSPFVKTKVQNERDLFTLTRKAQQIMSKNPPTVNVSATIQDAARILLDNNVALLPVMNEDGKTVGVLSWKDVMRFIVD